MYEALKADDLKAAQKEHDLLTRLMQVVGKYLRSHGRGVFCELMKLRGLPVERFPRWETPAIYGQGPSRIERRLGESRLQGINLPGPSLIKRGFGSASQQRELPAKEAAIYFPL